MREVRSDGCPFCGTEEVEDYKEPEIHADGVIQQVARCKCGKVWADVFILSEQRELDASAFPKDDA